MKHIDNGRRIEVERNPEWQVAVESAIKTALSFEEADRRDDEINRATSKFLNGSMDADAYRKLDDAYRSDTRGHVSFSDVNTFRTAIIWILKKYYPGYGTTNYEARANELIAHEEDHYQEALENGMIDVKFLVRFFKDKMEGISFRPAVSFDFPQNLSDQQYRDLLRSIIEAPEELSDADEKMRS